MKWLLTCAALCLVYGATGYPDWWKTSVLYQIYPRSYMDSNNDGNGDLKGIISKIPYIKDLGVGIIWLSPIYASPWKDMGYDISNFTDVHPEFGSLDDVKELISKAHEAGLKIFMDLVPNHSSDEHPWFKASKTGTGDEKDFYVWKDPKAFVDGKPVPPNNWLSNFGGSAWTYDEGRKQYYFHEFGAFQPDLNYNNPKVVEQMKDVIRFWFDLGIDGFRCDTVVHLVEDSQFKDEPLIDGCNDVNARGCYQHIYTENQPGTYAVLKQFDELIQKEYNSTRFLILEVYATVPQTVKYYQPNSSPFNFFLITKFSEDSTAKELAVIVDDYLQQVPKGMRPTWVIGNHDQSRVGTRMGEDLIDAMNMLVLLLPGTPTTYQGEEIGMVDAYIRSDEILDVAGRDPQRSPMQWDSSTNAGFSKAAKTWLPLNANYWHVNVESEKNDPTSHLSTYKKIMELKKQLKDVTDFKPYTEGDYVFYFKRETDKNTYYVVLNLNDYEETLPSSLLGGKTTVYIPSANSEYKVGDTIADVLNLPPRSGIVLQASK